MKKAIDISIPLKLAGEVEIKNRIFKAAMSEQLGDRNHNPGSELLRLYKTWADGGIGIAITGNVMVDRNALGEPKNVVLDEISDLDRFKAWAEAASGNDTHVWMQLNHPGKQSPKFLSKTPVAPSAVPLEVDIKSVFNMPRALADSEIYEIINNFATSAELAKMAGFSGVQIHCAHGYLLNQFLSPWHNRREDQWGGSLDNRMRILAEIYRAIRNKVGANFPIGLKLNSADFKDGGFTADESQYVAISMQNEGIDLLEISGGSYENPAMTGEGVRAQLNQREAYFIEYADTIRPKLKIPLVVTGGFRSGSAMNAALSSGVTDMIGMARPLAVEPDLPNKLFNSSEYVSVCNRPSTGFAMLDYAAMLDITWYESQLFRIGRGKRANPKLSAWRSVFQSFGRTGAYAFKQRRRRSAKRDLNQN